MAITIEEACTLLGVTRDQDERTVRNKYRLLAGRCHPDRGDNADEALYKRLGLAVEILTSGAAPGPAVRTKRSDVDFIITWDRRTLVMSRMSEFDLKAEILRQNRELASLARRRKAIYDRCRLMRWSPDDPRIPKMVKVVQDQIDNLRADIATLAAWL